MKRLVAGALCAILFTPILVVRSSHAANASRGAELFDDQCGDCHTSAKGGKNGRGPNLFGIVGRKAGTIPGFEYSAANSGSGVVWSVATLDPYLAAPKQAMPGTAMRYKGMSGPGDRADIIAFLAALK